MKMKYSKEFKEQAIKLSDEIGVKQACAQLGLVYSTLADWRKSYNRERILKEKPLENAPLTEREKKLMKENAGNSGRQTTSSGIFSSHAL